MSKFSIQKYTTHPITEQKKIPTIDANNIYTPKILAFCMYALNNTAKSAHRKKRESAKQTNSKLSLNNENGVRKNSAYTRACKKKWKEIQYRYFQ